MASTFKLTLDQNGNTGLLSIINGIKRDSRLSKAAVKEAENGYILDTAEPCGSFVRFDVTTIIGDIMADSNGFFDFVKATVDKPERYAFTQQQLRDYFAAGNFSVQRIEQLMGKFNASFGETGENGYTVYICSNIQQVVFSVLHFLIINGYKFSNCKHCGRLYATKNLKTVYCNRFSPFPGYERYSCRDAVKRINDSLNKRCRAIDSALRQREKQLATSEDDDGKLHIDRTHKIYKMREAFGIKCASYKDKIKDNPTVENLEEYSHFLYSGEGLPKRYERLKETLR